MYIEVQVALTADSVDKPFHYALPPHLKGLVSPGMRVEVPFGTRNTEAFVLGFVEEPEVSNVKMVTKILDTHPLLTSDLLQLSRWVSHYYMCSHAAVLQAMLPFPPGIARKGTRFVKLSFTGAKMREVLSTLERRAPRQARVLTILEREGQSPLTYLLRAAGADHSVVKALKEKGLITLTTQYGQDDDYPVIPADSRVTLTPEQAFALVTLEKSLSREAPETYLLHGVTGSGKTEVYLRIIEATVNKGRGAIIMVPEISLTTMMIERFRSYFGSQVALLHSKLSQGERYEEWCRLLTGDACIAVGPRSAVFAPVRNPGVIILDEEHERTYKQEETPRYHASRVAQERAHLNKSLLVLGSATPSLESYFRARQGAYGHLELPQRIASRAMPPVQIVDMREELKAGNKKMFSRKLLSSLESTLEKGEKTLLFLNRRGHSTCVLCRECGLVIRCPLCDISLTYHSQQNKMMCHYCAYTARVPKTCPKCTSRYIKYFGTGTQKVEEEIRLIFPGADIWRMDTDTTARKNAHTEILAAFEKSSGGILIGTQMVAKGLDIAGITLVGVIAADIGLHFPDFRSEERTFQLLTQVAGRAGRGERVGSVIVQTYDPEHYSILAAKDHDFKGFYAREIENRRELGYPPFSIFVRVVFSGKEERLLEEAAAALIEKILPREGVEVLGPVQCPFSKVRDKYRWHLVLKGQNKDILRQEAGEIIKLLRKNFRKLTVIADVEPLNML